MESALEIADILSVFSAIDPRKRGYVISEDQMKAMLQELCSTAAPYTEKTILYSAGYLYIIAYFFATCSLQHFDLSLLYKGCAFVESLLLESFHSIHIFSDNFGQTLKILHPSDALDMYCVKMGDIYDRSLEVLRLLTKDLIAELRRFDADSKNYFSAKTNRIHMQPPAIYFICTFALSHIATSLKWTAREVYVPGIGDILVTIAFCLPGKDDFDESSRPRGVKERMRELLVLSSAVANTTLTNVFDEQYIVHCRALRWKILQWRTPHSDVSYMRLQCRAFGHFFQPHSKSQGATAGTAFEHPAPVVVEAKHKADLGLMMDRAHRCPSLNFGAIFASTGPDTLGSFWSTCTAIEEEQRRQHAMPLDSFGGLKWTLNRKEALPQSNGPGKVNKDVEAWLSTHPSMKMAFLLFRAVHRSNANIGRYFPTNWTRYRSQNSQMKLDDALNSQSANTARGLSLNKRVDRMEEIMYSMCVDVATPRVLNPSQPLYWISGFILECLYHKTVAGECFSRALQNEIAHTRRQYKQIIHLNSTSHVRKHQRQVQTTLTMSSSILSTATHSSSICDVDRRLKAAKKQAEIEIKLNRLVDTVASASATFALTTTLPHIQGTTLKASPLSNSDGITSRPQTATAATASSVWASLVEKVDDNVSKAAALFSIDMAEKGEEFMKGLAKKYGEDIRRSRELIESRRKNEEAAMAESQAIEEVRLQRYFRAKKQEELKKREDTKQASLLLKNKYKVQKDLLQREENMRTAQEVVRANEAAKKELERLHRNKELTKQRALEEKRDRLLREELERERSKGMISTEEMLLNARMLDEEVDMRRCEELRRFKDQHRHERIQQQLQQQESRRQLTRYEIDAATARVRRGNFVYHQGRLGFYEDVRKEAVPWIQYEDTQGRFYYYDPLCNKTQYREPSDAPYYNYNEAQRAAYDLENGDGAHDRLVAEIEFKRSVNENGGWYTENGVWMVAYGYYSEEGEWISLDGYYDDNGRYIRYPKVSGDLSFMV